MIANIGNLFTDIDNKITTLTDTNITGILKGNGLEIVAATSADYIAPVTGYGLTKNDLTDVLKGHYDTAYSHTSLTNNPHSVTKAQVGLTNADDTSDLNKPASTLFLKTMGLANSLPKFAGQYYDNMYWPGASTTLTSVRNKVYLFPYIVHRAWTIDLIGVAVSTGSGAGSHKAYIVIYNSLTTGYPGTPETSPVEITGMDTTGYKSVALSYTFQPGLYWIAINHDNTAVLRGSGYSAFNMGMPSGSVADASSYNYIGNRSLTYGQAFPNPWTLVTTDFLSGSGINVSFRMRCA
jgi:hypothetical protein